MGLLRIRRRMSSDDSPTDWIELDAVPDLAFEGTSLFTEKKKKRKNDLKLKIEDLPILLVVVTVGLSLLLVKSLDSLLPEPVRRQDSSNGTIIFNEERARDDLELLTSVGVRITGSEATDVTTVNQLVSMLNKIESSRNFNRNLTLDIDIQRPSGSFQIGDEVSVYSQISNVVARLQPNNSPSNDAVLVNCHFDTKPGSPGATDNMISCATMLETLRVLSEAPALRNPVVFLFNGAEELGLQGAHGFVRGDGGKGHPWSSNLRCFINLEGAGAGGKEILFQSGPGNSWILEAYREAAPYPYGLVLGEEAFQRNLIPSDTDFRIFRDYKDIPGLDMAFIKNGWLYHTKWDKVTEIPPGSIQHVGANTLALVQKLGNLDFSTVILEKSGTQMVFFDVFGLFMVAYSESVGIILSFVFATIFILLAAFEIRVTISRLLILVMLPLSALLAWGLGLGVSVFVGAFFNWIGYPKPFFSYPFLALVLFGLPVLFMQALVYSICWRGSQRKSWLAGKFTLAIVLMAGAYLTRAVYILCLHMFFAILAWVPRPFFKRLKMPVVELVSDVLVGDLIPFVFSSYLAIFLSDVFVPIMGRSGSGKDPNIFLSLILGAVLSVLVLNGLSSYIASQRKIGIIFCLVFSVFILNPLIVVGFVGRVPYQEKTPMRIQIQDTDRTWYDESLQEIRTEAGYWFSVVDGDTIEFMPELAKTVNDLRGFEELNQNEDGCEELSCSQPFLWYGVNLKKTPWVPKNYGLPYSMKDRVRMEVIQNSRGQDGKQNMTLRFKGPAQLSIALSPTPDWVLADWSLDVAPDNAGHTYQGRPVYYIYVGKGYDVPEFELNISLTSLNGTSEGRIVDILYIGHLMHGANSSTSIFEELNKKFPAWTNVMSWTSVVKQYVIGSSTPPTSSQ